MNKLHSKRFGTLVSSILIISSLSFAQLKNVDFMRISPSDGVKLLKAYISPWTNAFGAGLNGGWYNTAKPHKFGGFDITTSINIGMVPSSAETYDISNLGLSSSISGTGLAPTVAGSTDNGPNLTYKVNGINLASFNTPPGTNWKMIPVPTAQIGIGLPLGTELKLRYIPKITMKNGDISLWGVGLMHSLIQYIPGNKMLPFDVSIFGGYTKLEGNVHLNLQPDATVIQNYTTGYLDSHPFDNQNLNVAVTALNVGVIASLNLPVITFYGGLGYGKTNTGMAITGNFPIPVPVLTPAPHAEYNNIANSGSVIAGSAFKDLDIKNFSGLQANIGLRIKLAVITIHADYTKAQYNVFSTGLGISFR